MIGLAEDIIDKMSGQFQPDKFEDRYENAMIELIRSKQAGLPAPKEKTSSRPACVQPDGCAPSQHRGQRRRLFMVASQSLHATLIARYAAAAAEAWLPLALRIFRFHCSPCGGARGRPSPEILRSGGWVRWVGRPVWGCRTACWTHLDGGERGAALG
jgi:hypothetical protein